jgi:hypothetical protein
MAEKLQQGFVTLLRTFLEELAAAFPECSAAGAAQVPETPEALDAVIRQLRQGSTARLAALQARDPEALRGFQAEVPLLAPLALDQKLQDPGLSAESRDQIWRYVAMLCTFAEFYTAVPSALLGKIEGAATTLVQQNGAMLTSLLSGLAGPGAGASGATELTQLGQDLLAGFSPEDLRDFEKSLPQLYGAVGSLSQLFQPDAAGAGDFNPIQLLEQLSALQSSDRAEGRADGAGLLASLTSMLQGGAAATTPLAALPPAPLPAPPRRVRARRS